MAGLVGFIVNLIALLAAGAIFFLSIDKVAPDAFFAKIAKIAIGALLLIALVVTVAGVFGIGGGGLAVAPLGIIYFAIAVIVAVAVLYIINLVIDWIGAQMGDAVWGQGHALSARCRANHAPPILTLRSGRTRLVSARTVEEARHAYDQKGTQDSRCDD